MKLKNFILLSLLLAFISSCGGAKTIGKDTNREIKRDSITTVKTEIKRDTIRIPGDTLKMYVPISDLTETPLIQVSESGRTKASLSKQGNAIKVECFTEDFETIIETQNTIIETLIKQLEHQKTIQTVKVTESPWYIKALASIGALLIVFIGIKVVTKFT